MTLATSTDNRTDTLYSSKVLLEFGPSIIPMRARDICHFDSILFNSSLRSVSTYLDTFALCCCTDDRRKKRYRALDAKAK